MPHGAIHELQNPVMSRRTMLGTAAAVLATPLVGLNAVARADQEECAVAPLFDDFQSVHTRPGGIGSLPFETKSVWRDTSGTVQIAIVRSDGLLIALDEGQSAQKLVADGTLSVEPPVEEKEQPLLSEGEPPSALVAIGDNGTIRAREFSGDQLAERHVASTILAMANFRGKPYADETGLFARLEPLQSAAAGYLTPDLALDDLSGCAKLGCNFLNAITSTPGRLVRVQTACDNILDGQDLSAGTLLIAEYSGHLFALATYKNLPV